MHAGPHADPLPEIRQRSQRSSPAEPPTPAPSPATGPAASLPASSFMQYAHHQPPSLMRHSTSGVGRSSPTQAAVKQPSPSTSTGKLDPDTTHVFEQHVHIEWSLRATCCMIIQHLSKTCQRCMPVIPSGWLMRATGPCLHSWSNVKLKE